MSVFQLLEHNIVSFVKNELKRMQRATSTCLDDDVITSEEEEEDMRSCREAFQKITQLFLRRMKQEGMAASLQSSKLVVSGTYVVDRSKAAS